MKVKGISRQIGAHYTLGTDDKLIAFPVTGVYLCLLHFLTGLTACGRRS